MYHSCDAVSLEPRLNVALVSLQSFVRVVVIEINGNDRAAGLVPRVGLVPLCQLVGNLSCILKEERRLQHIKNVRACRGRGQGRGLRAMRAGQRAARCEVKKHKPTIANAPANGPLLVGF